MTKNESRPTIRAVADPVVWWQTKVLFLGAALLFLVNIAFGFANALTTGAIPRWQVLFHLHSGAIGWITLSLIGLAIWLFTGQRAVSAAYGRWVRRFVLVSVLVFTGYVAAFALAFSQSGGFVLLLPIFGTASMLVIWAAAGFALSQWRHQPVVTTVHVLVVGGLLVAAIGATMGVLLGLEYVVGLFLPVPITDRVGVHAGMMDAYVLIVAAAIVEWFVRKDAAGRVSRSGLTQAVAGTAAAIVVPLAFLLDRVEQLLPAFAILLLVFLALFLGRMGWRALRANPLQVGEDAWGFFGAAWLIVFVALFLWAAVGLQGDFTAAPSWFPAVFAHTAFVGMMTNLLFGVYSVRTRAAADVYHRVEPAAMWLLNGGLVLFIALEVAMDSRHGAFVMGFGALLGIGVMIFRLHDRAAGKRPRRSGDEETAD